MAGIGAGLEEIMFHAMILSSGKFHFESFYSTILKVGVAIRETKREKDISLKIHIPEEERTFVKERCDHCKRQRWSHNWSCDT